MPVVMCSATTEAGADGTLEALAIGAVDFWVTKPGTGSRTLTEYRDTVVAKLRAAAYAQVRRPTVTGATARHIAGTTPGSVRAGASRRRPSRSRRRRDQDRRLDRRRGRDRAVARDGAAGVLPPVLVTQHIPAVQPPSPSARIAQLPHRARGHAGCAPREPGHVTSPGGQQFSIVASRRWLSLRSSNVASGSTCNRPSVDVLFHSVAEHTRVAAIGDADWHGQRRRAGHASSDARARCLQHRAGTRRRAPSGACRAPLPSSAPRTCSCRCRGSGRRCARSSARSHAAGTERTARPTTTRIARFAPLFASGPRLRPRDPAAMLTTTPQVPPRRLPRRRQPPRPGLSRPPASVIVGGRAPARSCSPCGPRRAVRRRAARRVVRHRHPGPERVDLARGLPATTTACASCCPPTAPAASPGLRPRPCALEPAAGLARARPADYMPRRCALRRRADSPGRRAASSPRSCATARSRCVLLLVPRQSSPPSVTKSCSAAPSTALASTRARYCARRSPTTPPRVILAHNHPSGVAEFPARRTADHPPAARCARPVDIRVLDHLIIAGPDAVPWRSEACSGGPARVTV